MKYQGIAVGIVCIAGSIAQADVARVGEFASLQFEGFDDERWSFERGTKSAFGGIGEVFASSGGVIHTTGSWGLSSGDWRARTRAYDGNMLGNMGGSINYRFNETQKSFGGFFATIADVSDGTIKFYDASDQLVGQDEVVAALGGDWGWNGWTSETGFSRVEVTGNYRNGSGGFLMHDSLRVSVASVPAPGAIALVLGSGAVIARRRRRVL